MDGEKIREKIAGANAMKLSRRLFLLVKQIPTGKVATYKMLAERLGTSARAVGRMLGKNPHPIVVPCHRVVCSGGGVGGYKLGVKKKIALLGKEGVKIENGNVDLKRYLFGL